MTIINPKSISGVTSITTASGADNLLTVHTNNTTERVRINNDGDVIVGSGITVSPDGDIFATGVTTATTFSGSGASLTNLPAANITGTLPAISGANLTNLDASDLASGTVPTARLGSGTASSSTFLRGDSTFATVTSVGGATGVDFNDNVKARFGTGNDLEIYHNASHSIIHDNGTGDLKIIGDDVIIQADNDDTMAKFIEDGAVELYHNGTKKIETSSNGVTISGQAQIDGNSFPYSDNNSDLGLSSNRWQDLFLSGNIYLGGTGSANALDDYEEGTFSPAFSGDSGGGSYGYSKQVGTYTKIGNTVHFQIYLKTNAVNANATGNTLITGLPFTASSGDNGYTGVCIGYYTGWNGITPSQALVDTSNTRIYLYKNNGTSAATYSYPGDIITNSSIIIAGHYFTAA